MLGLFIMMRLLNKKICIKKPYIPLLLDHHKKHTELILDLYLILTFTIVVHMKCPFLT